jgi:hypothetical protein
VSNPSGRKGTAWESGWPYVERRRLSGRYDRGDIAGIPGVVIEAKNAKTVALAAWLDEAIEECMNDKADLGVAWFKRRGKVSAGEGFVVMDGKTFTSLLTAAGYGGGA